MIIYIFFKEIIINDQTEKPSSSHNLLINKFQNSELKQLKQSPARKLSDKIISRRKSLINKIKQKSIDKSIIDTNLNDNENQPTLIEQ